MLSVTVTASARAVPGARAAVDVTVAAFGGLSSTIQLLVGQAAADTPRGATLSQACDVTSGSGCTIAVVGVSGEYDPFAGRPGAGLTLSQVGANGTVDCSVATVGIADDHSVRVTWPSSPKPAGGTCQVPFTVVDAQGRLGTGLLQLDVRGYPAAPASLTQSGYTGTSVSLDVALGAAASAHPGVTGAAIYENGRQVGADCAATGAATYRCTVSGLNNGDKHSYTARVHNAVGESVDTTPVTAWAYSAPAASIVSLTPQFEAGQTSPDNGSVHGVVTTGDDVSSLTLAGTDVRLRNLVNHGQRWEFDVTLAVGPATVTVVPTSRFQPPDGTNTSGAAATGTVTVVGAPSARSYGRVTEAGTVVSVSAPDVDARFGPALSVAYVIGTADDLTCQVGPNGALTVGGTGARQSDTGTFTLANDTVYDVLVCAWNAYGLVSGKPTNSSGTIFTTGAPTGDATYGFSGDPASTLKGGVTTFTYPTKKAPGLTADAGMVIKYSINGGDQTTDFWSWSGWSLFQVPSDIQASQCSRASGRCSPSVTVTVAAGAAPGGATVQAQHVCVMTSKSTRTTAQPSPFTATPDGQSAVTGPTPDSDTAPTKVTWTLRWQGAYGDLTAITYTDKNYEVCP